MIIRKYNTMDDKQVIASIYAKSWQSAYKDILPQEYLQTIDSQRWLPIFDDSLQQMLIAIDDEQIVGVTTCSKARDERLQDWGEIISIYLLPAYYHQGIGTKLLQGAMQELFDQGFLNIYLWVLAENKNAIAFYKKNGFIQSDETVTINIGGKLVTEVRFIYTL